jgi:hypothetical protein
VTFMPGPNQTFDLLKTHHAQIVSLLGSLHRGGGSREDLIYELFVELRVHSVLEQQLFYPAVSTILSKDKPVSAQRELHMILALMLELEREETDSEQFQQDLAMIAEGFNHHVHEQEGVLFAEVAAHSNAVDFGALATRLETSKADVWQSMRARMKPHNASSQGEFAGSPLSKQTRCA